jgi:hypothetical protein
MCVDFQGPVQRIIERGKRRSHILTRGHFIILNKNFTNWINLLENYHHHHQQQQQHDDDGNWGIICKID